MTVILPVGKRGVSGHISSYKLHRLHRGTYTALSRCKCSENELKGPYVHVGRSTMVLTWASGMQSTFLGGTIH